MRMLLAITMLAQAALAQDSVPGAQDAPPMGQPAFDAFARARAVVLGEDRPDAELPPDLPEAWGASVTLRQDGRRFVADVLAFDRPRAGLVDAAARELPALVGAIDQGAARFTVELAGRPSMIDGTRGLGDVALSIRPGLDAVAVRTGDASAVVFPDAALAGAMLPSDMVVTALREAMAGRLPAGIADEPGAWERYADAALKRGEAEAFRAPVTVLAQGDDGLAPSMKHRGGRVVGLQELNPERLRDWARDMAAHLQRRRYDGLEPYGLRGTLDPLTGRHLSPIDEPFAQALAAHALLRYGSSSWADEEDAQRATTAGVVLLRQLALVTPVRIGAMEELGDEAPLEPEPWGNPAAAAMTIVALAHLEPAAFEAYPELASMRERCASVVRSAVGLSITGSAIFSDDAPVATHGLLALAMVRLGESDVAQGEDLQAGRAAARAVIARVEPELLVGQMPWVLMALGPGERMTGGEALVRMRELVWQHQLAGPEVDGDDRDLAGGIVFTRGGPPLPTWQSARAAVAAGAMLNDPRLTAEADRAGEFLRVLRTLRFLRQLTVDESLGHLLEADDLAAGGVRAAAWDQRQPSIATSLTLLAVCDALDAAYAPR